MKHRLFRLLAVSSILFAFAALPGRSARRPRYGGNLRIEVGTVLNSLDQELASANPAAVAANLEIFSLIYDVLNRELKFAVPGPFHVTAFLAGKRAVLTATEDYRLGRPFVDSIEIAMGRSAQERIVDLELNKTDFAEIPAEDARKASELGVRVSRSQPDELLALVFSSRLEPERGDPVEARVREVIALSIDRAAIVNFILQKEAEAAGGLIPQWSSGTAFLFSTVPDSAHAKELSAQINPAAKFVLGYDFGDPLEQAVAERIVVNAREAGIPLTAQAIRTEASAREPGQRAPEVDARLVRLRMASKLPAVALEDFMETLSTMTTIGAQPLLDSASPEDIYNRERAIVNSYRVIPLVWLPRVYGLSARVRNWTPPGPGESWPLADVWLDGPVEAVSDEGKK
jgi:MarR-like DNA-binding transcriptional regulator SgrR of sgrS sRNA